MDTKEHQLISSSTAQPYILNMHSVSDSSEDWAVFLVLGSTLYKEIDMLLDKAMAENLQRSCKTECP